MSRKITPLQRWRAEYHLLSQTIRRYRGFIRRAQRSTDRRMADAPMIELPVQLHNLPEATLARILKRLRRARFESFRSEGVPQVQRALPLLRVEAALKMAERPAVAAVAKAEWAANAEKRGRAKEAADLDKAEQRYNSQ